MPGRYLNHAYEYRQALHQYPYSANWYNQFVSGGLAAGASQFYKDRTAEVLEVSPKYSVTRTQTKTTEEESPQERATAMEYSRKSRKRGRKMKQSVHNLYKLTSAVRAAQVFRWQHVNPFATSTCGAQKIFNHRYTAPNAGYLAPIHIYDLSTWAGPSETSGSGIPRFGTGTAYNLSFLQNGPGMNNVSTTSTGSFAGSAAWQVEYAPRGTGFMPQGPQDLLEWVEVSMLCYGRTGVPTRFRIMLCQIPDEDYNPFTADLQEDTVGGMADGTAAWEAAMAPFNFNPIMKYDVMSNSSRVFKPLMVEDFILSSDMTDFNSASIPVMKQIRMFSRLNRRQNYMWRALDTLPPTEIGNGAGPQGGDFNVQSLAPEQGPHPSSRVYLVVMAMSTQTSSLDQSAPPTWSAATQPSYDIILRKKHVGLIPP